MNQINPHLAYPVSKSRPLVLAHGCFDLLHIGHIHHLQEAKKLGSRLIVSVTSDRFVAKGAGRPHFTAEQRAEALRALDCVDEVIINDASDAVSIIEKLKPEFYTKGIDYAGETKQQFQAETAEVLKHGGVPFITNAEKFSSSRIINAEKNSKEVVEYLDYARKSGFLSRIEDAFAKVKELRVLFVGESIADEYVYVAPLSKPSKEFVLAAAEISTESFAGGVHAAAAHLNGLCAVKVVTQPEDEPLTKRRYVERGFTRKLFEVYSPARLNLDLGMRAAFLGELQEGIQDADVVIVLDFGHGLINENVITDLARSKFLAANAQTNAGNQGFNLVTKYAGADFICVDAPEARLAVQDQYGKIEDVLAELERRAQTENVIITHGREGSYVHAAHIPAIATHTVDTMGAGDCFLAFTAPLVAAGLGIEEAAFVGNVAAGMKTGIVGHREAVNAEVLHQTVRALLQ